MTGLISAVGAFLKTLGLLLGLLKSESDKKAGVAMQRAEDLSKAEAASERIAESEAQEPQVEDRLKHGSF